MVNFHILWFQKPINITMILITEDIQAIRMAVDAQQSEFVALWNDSFVWPTVFFFFSINRMKQ